MDAVEELRGRVGEMAVADKNERGYQAGDSRLKGDRLKDFLRAPIQEDLRSFPFVGRVSKNMMIKAGVTNTYQLIGKFLELRATGDTPQQHCDKFWHWLEEHGTSAAHRSSLTHAMAEKLNILCPGMFPAELKATVVVAENVLKGEVENVVA